MGNTAVVNKVFTPGGNKKSQNNQGGHGQQRSGISNAEKKRRTVMKGKCTGAAAGNIWQIIARFPKTLNAAPAMHQATLLQPACLLLQ